MSSDRIHIIKVLKWLKACPMPRYTHFTIENSGYVYFWNKDPGMASVANVLAINQYFWTGYKTSFIKSLSKDQLEYAKTLKYDCGFIMNDGPKHRVCWKINNDSND